MRSHASQMRSTFTLSVLKPYNDYEHVEFAGTVFAEALSTHDLTEFSAIGEEAFVQPVDTQTFGLFFVQI